LVLLVNPNDFRAYMVHEVAERSGYQLNSMARCAGTSGRSSAFSRAHDADRPGAEEPVIRADNMRLDVALLPLLSHQLQVKQVMLKGAVIQLTPKTEAVRDSERRWCRTTIRCRWCRRIAAGPTMCAAAGGRQRALFPA
jgi:AsmA protein